MNKLIDFEIETRVITTFNDEVISTKSIKLYFEKPYKDDIETIMTLNNPSVKILSNHLGGPFIAEKLSDYIYDETPLYLTFPEAGPQLIITDDEEYVIAFCCPSA